MPRRGAETIRPFGEPAAHRESYNRRTAAERTFSTVKDPATTNLARGTCRLTSLTPNALHAATALIGRNIRVTNAFAARRTEHQRREARGLPPKTRKRRRTTLHDLAATAHPP